MIPTNEITAWAHTAPWPTPDQVEQDLLLSQLFCLIAGDDYLGDELVFRGGTCLHKLYLHPARRYSEDRDYVRSTARGIGKVTKASPARGGYLSAPPAPPNRTAAHHDVRSILGNPRPARPHDLRCPTLPERLTRMVAVPARSGAQLVQDHPLLHPAGLLTTHRDRLGHCLPLAHRRSHHRDLPTARPPARQARSTRALLNESTNPPTRALLMSQRGTSQNRCCSG